MCIRLYEAEQFDDLFSLVTSSKRWAEERHQREGNYKGFLSDLELAWQWAESEASWDIGNQLRCLLIESSIHGLEENLQNDDAPDRVMIGRRLIYRQPNEFEAATLAMAIDIRDETERAHALMSLIKHLPDHLKQQALAALLALKDEDERLHILCMSAHDLPISLREQFITPEFISAIAEQDDETQAFALD